MLFIHTEILTGAEAFGLEEAVVEDSRFKETTILFTWRTKPTVMIGRFQNALKECRMDLIAERGVDFVRRTTGGGTIFTDDGALQFSVVAPRTHSDGTRQNAIDFARFLVPVRGILNEIGFSCEISSRNDLLCQGLKFNGNAQRIAKERILHHGSILYSCDTGIMGDLLTPPKIKMKSKGISSVKQRVINLFEVDPEKRGIQAFQEDFDRALKSLDNEEKRRCLLEAGALVENDGKLFFAPEILARAEAIAKEKFTSDDWNIGKNPAFSLESERLTKGGFLKLYLDIDKQKIRSIRLEGDFFMGEGELEAILQQFIDMPYEKARLSPLLEKVSESLAIYQLSAKELEDLFFPQDSEEDEREAYSRK